MQPSHSPALPRPHRGKLLASCRGFTMVEIILVLLIISLSVGIAIPRIGAGWKRIEDREFLQAFVQTLRRARLQAMNSGQITAFRIRSSERLFGIVDPPDMPIPPNVDIFADHLEQDPDTGDHLIVFYPDGSLVGDNVELLFDKQRSFLVSIHPLFGTVQWAKVDSK